MSWDNLVNHQSRRSEIFIPEILISLCNSIIKYSVDNGEENYKLKWGIWWPFLWQIPIIRMCLVVCTCKNIRKYLCWLGSAAFSFGLGLVVNPATIIVIFSSLFYLLFRKLLLYFFVDKTLVLYFCECVCCTGLF